MHNEKKAATFMFYFHQRHIRGSNLYLSRANICTEPRTKLTLLCTERFICFDTFFCRTSSYLPHRKRVQKSGGPQPRRGRIVWEDDDSMGAAVAPKGSFPWMVSLFVLLKNGEALFMCAGALITPNLAVTAAHCFTNNEKKTTWYAY